jgi:hypothetical protein
MAASDAISAARVFSPLVSRKTTATLVAQTKEVHIMIMRALMRVTSTAPLSIGAE